jgi:hypothetical protein
MPYTIGEKLRLTWLVAKSAKQAAAHDKDSGDDWQPDSRIDREMDRIKDRKDQRRQDDEAAMRSVLATARRDVAMAKANVRTARGAAEKRAARDEEREVNRGLRRIEGDARRKGYRI